MIRVVLVVAALLVSAFSAWADEGPWSGSWATKWRGGGARLEMSQTGNRVTGTYPLYGGRIDAVVDGRHLKGTWTEDERAGGFDFTLSRDGISFTGFYDSGEWWTGERTTEPPERALENLTSPREAFRSFVEASNAVRAGRFDAAAVAVDAMDFGPDGAAMLPGQRFAAAERLFNTMALTTFRIWSVPGPEFIGQELPLRLEQAGTGAVLPLTMRRSDDGSWRIVAPTAEAMAQAREALLARNGGRPRPVDAYLQLASPRDTIRSFMEGMEDWNGSGRDQAFSTMDLSALPQATRAEQSELAAQYLKRVINKLGTVNLQSIPDDPTNRTPYVYFEHPAGQIVITPTGDGQNAVWKFSIDTVAGIGGIYRAISDVPGVLSRYQGPAPPSSYFTLRKFFEARAPFLLTPFGAIEQWQAVVHLILFAIALVLAALLSGIVLAGMKLLLGSERLHEAGRLLWPVRMLIFCLLWQALSPIDGMPQSVRAVSVPAIGVLLAFSGVFVGWRLIDVIGYRFVHARETRASMDNIVLSLMLGLVRAALVVMGAINVADVLSLPYGSIMAGLGISGLAIAFASRETLSNVFGAAILVADRPFRSGDWIAAGDIQGTVEHVGIRSTRLRTVEDTILVVPNGKLADATINNWGTRRHRLAKARLLVAYGSKPEQLDRFTAGLKDLVASSTGFVASRTQVGVTSLAESGIEVELTCYMHVPTLSAERAAKHRLMMDILNLAESLGLKIGAQATEVLVMAQAPQLAGVAD